MTQIIITQDAIHKMLLDGVSNKDHKSQITKFADYLQTHQINLLKADLNTYRDHLQSIQPAYAPSTIQAHIQTIRLRYRLLSTDNAIRDQLLDHYADYQIVNEIVTRLKNIGETKVKVRTITKQDHIKSEHRWLSITEINRLRDMLVADHIAEVKSLRDLLFMELVLATGIRREETVNLNLPDLYQIMETRDAEIPVLHIREGKGAKTRNIPYGANIDVLQLALLYLSKTNIAHLSTCADLQHCEKVPVFRGFTRGYKIKSRPMGKSSVNYIFRDYPITLDDGSTYTIEPHDLRRTYARGFMQTNGWEFETLLALQKNLGHANIETTMRYVNWSQDIKREPIKRMFRGN